jgi:hypothetical protein
MILPLNLVLVEESLASALTIIVSFSHYSILVHLKQIAGGYFPNWKLWACVRFGSKAASQHHIRRAAAYGQKQPLVDG